MNPVDALLLLLLVPFTLRGYYRGLCREGLALTGVVVGLVASMALAPTAAAVLVGAGASELIAFPAAVMGIMILASLSARLAGAVVARIAHAVMLGGVDRLGGSAFGALKGAAVLGIALLALERFVPAPVVQAAIAESLLGPQLMRVASHVVEVGREIVSAARPS